MKPQPPVTIDDLSDEPIHASVSRPDVEKFLETIGLNSSFKRAFYSTFSRLRVSGSDEVYYIAQRGYDNLIYSGLIPKTPTIEHIRELELDGKIIVARKKKYSFILPLRKETIPNIKETEELSFERQLFDAAYRDDPFKSGQAEEQYKRD